MQKIVTNRCYGGFGLSDQASMRYANLKELVVAPMHWKISRDDPILVQVVEELGETANGSCAELEVTEIPDGVE